VVWVILYEHVSSFRESSVSVCVEGTVVIPEPNQSLIPECFDTSGYVRSLFVLDSPINASLDHITGIVQDYLQQEAIELLPWSAMSPDMNPIKQLWDYLGRKVNVNNEYSRLASCTVPENVS
jgi:hypothetical protein